MDGMQLGVQQTSEASVEVNEGDFFCLLLPLDARVRVSLRVEQARQLCVWKVGERDQSEASSTAAKDQ